MLHWLPRQTAAPLAGMGHLCPQFPQLVGSLLVFVQVPLQQVAPMPQALPQVPQLVGSVLVLVQVYPPPVEGQQVGLPAFTPAPQALPQAPQLLLFVVTVQKVPLGLVQQASPLAEQQVRAPEGSMQHWPL